VTGVQTCALPIFSALGYADALELASTPIQPRAVQLLNKFLGRAEVASIASPYESVIGRFGRTPAQPAKMSPTRVLILALDELGESIYRRVAAMPEHFLVIGVFHPEGAGQFADVPPEVPRFESLHAAMSQCPDVVIDALSGLEPAHSLDSHFLAHGASVVSANLPLVADAGRPLNTLAARSNTYLRYNAAVGGSAPMMEALRREIHMDDVRSIAAVFSGAASHILDRCSKGFAFEELLLNATAELGLAAVHEEVLGTRSARKLCVLARHAFGHDPDAFRVEALDAESLARARDSLSENCTLRLVARAWKISHRVFGQLKIEALDTRDPLAQVQPEWNRLIITHRNDRQMIVQGRDGPWPTTEALMADLLDVRFAHLAVSKPAARTAH
jgi:homoserine dehydrogenase